MKATLVAIALAASAMTGIANAAVPAASPTNETVAQATTHHADAGKTRAEVKRELAQAQRSGEIAALRSLYQGS